MEQSKLTFVKQKTVLKRIFKEHQTLTVVGGNWGDEGKGKIIDLLMGLYDITARFSGGANAGHTVKLPSGVEIIGHLIPCGIAQNKTCVMGRGELIDLRLFKKELEESSKALKGKLPKIWLDEMSSLWTPWHALLEEWLEYSRGAARVGTTKKAIAPLEGLFRLRIAPVVGHIFLPSKEFVKVLNPLYEVLRPIFREMKAKKLIGGAVPSPSRVAGELRAYQKLVKKHIADTSFVLYEALKNNRRIMFEGAQAVGLDVRFGTYPYVSSGHSVASGAPVGTGLGVKHFDASVMVCKVLPTRVGMGPFVSEMWERDKAQQFAVERKELFEGNPDARKKFLESTLSKINRGGATGKDYSNYFQVLGDERGATTRRGRSVGFLDIPWLAYAVRINEPKYLALTRFDMLSGVKNIPVVVGYKYKGKKLEMGKILPSWQLKNVKPIIEKWPCWKENIFNFNSEKDLPKGARNFLSKMEKMLKVPILFVGTGPSRNAIVIREKRR
ncbi:MAG: hypothetical protein COT92_01385 [Candidatus Doudnabacteria bacterium CG10_big_fil_rev_8_21_14_0_10_42_18]|uniref:Adenylosuccinate synthetase n=1 Tax=Candidatus Doudnabacteria bacterium CG10_big_fil_rev_8_21_14_0_10_42_18 TaxID=1974552 RepID=A0A2H0VBA8_9BACT|nr:MAG: hypothetical protein COT92_01385 [Candidatus Doudnabacteria bacterium CG10_big_fil_rev_8_21_14_0_10_42_18]